MGVFATTAKSCGAWEVVLVHADVLRDKWVTWLDNQEMIRYWSR